MTTELGTPALAQEEYLKTLGGDYHPSLLLLHGQSPIVIDGKMPQGTFALGEYNFGREVDIYVCGKRWHALYLENKNKVLESYDFFSEITKKIRSIKRNFNAGIDPRFGYSYLVWIEKLERFGVFHPNTPAPQKSTASMVTLTTPIDQRRDVDKDMPYSLYFKLKTLQREKPQKHYVPDPIPFPDGMKPGNLPSKEAFDEAIEVFGRPVLAERNATATAGSTPGPIDAR